MGKNLLVAMSDKNGVEQAKQLFSSVYWNAGWKGDYMLLSYKIPEKELKWFRKEGILIKKCEPIFDKEKLKRLYNENKVEDLEFINILLIKFNLFTLEFKKWENLIYLDSDIIVKFSLDELTKIKGFAAIRDSRPKLRDHFTNFKKNKILLNDLKKDYNLEEKAFNAGVMVFNTDIITKDTLDNLKKLFEKYNKIRKLSDQTIFNLFFYKKWIELPIVYNWHYYLANFPLHKRKNSKVKGIILHFAGPIKPWKENCSFYQEWKNNLKKADLIDIEKPIEIHKLAKNKVKEYSKISKKRNFFYSAIREVDRTIGLIGIFLKNKHPMLYYLIKNKQSN